MSRRFIHSRARQKDRFGGNGGTPNWWGIFLFLAGYFFTDNIDPWPVHIPRILRGGCETSEPLGAGPESARQGEEEPDQIPTNKEKKVMMHWTQIHRPISLFSILLSCLLWIQSVGALSERSLDPYKQAVIGHAAEHWKYALGSMQSAHRYGSG